MPTPSSPVFSSNLLIIIPIEAFTCNPISHLLNLKELLTNMAPLVKLVIQILLGTTPIKENSYSIHKAETTPKPHHDVETFAPLLRSAISLSSTSWGYNRLDVFGAGGEVPTVQHKYWDGYQWNPSGKDLESLGSEITNPPVAVSWGKDRTDVFKVGLDNSVYHKYWDGSRWNPSKPEDWESLGGDFAVSYALAATSWGFNRLDVYGVGLDKDDNYAVWHKYWDGSSWGPSHGSGWEHLGGDFISEPAALSRGPGLLDVVAVDSSLNLLHKFFDGSKWTEWEVLGENFYSTPTVVSWGKDRLDVFGLKHDSKLWHKYWNGNQWSEWEDFGGQFVAAVAATSWGPNRIDIVGLGYDSAYHYKYWDGHQWNPSADGWYSKNGTFYSAPSLVSWGENRLDIFGVDTESNLAHQTWYGNGWYPSSNSWENLGGPVQPF